MSAGRPVGLGAARRRGCGCCVAAAATQTWMLVQVETQPPAPVSGPRLALRLPAALTRDRPVRWRLAWEGQGRSRGVWRLKF